VAEREKKRPATAGDMVRSLLVIIVPLLIISFFFSRNLGDHPVQTVDVGPVLAQAREEAPYPVLAPVNLPGDWQPTRVSWEPTGHEGAPPREHWQVGYLSPDRIYFAVNQSPDAEALLPAETRDGLPDGSSTLAGAAWERRVSADGRTRSLVRDTGPVTTVVVADADYAALEAFTGTLRSE
jgi:hypothetical protein